MLPQLSDIPKLSNQVIHYLDEVKKHHFKGDIASNYADRLSLATDNSVYQTIPSAILYPKTIGDVQLLIQLAQKPEFQSLTFTPRGGGTGTNGQSLNDNIIIDLSRYMTNILELNVKECWVRVQAGVVKDQLNQFLKPHGLFFSPELSTSNRATIGGMINTDASGQGSLQYGKTSQHVLEIKSVLMNGEILETQAVRSDQFFANLDKLNLSDTAKQLYSAIFTRCKEIRPQVLKDLPQLNRFLTGYDLKNVFNNDESEFNLTRILTGSEGSLAFICEAKLNLLPIPKYRTLINIKYNSFDSALRSAPMMLEAKALSVETIDSKVLNLAKQDIIWHSVSDLLLEDKNNPILGINIVEYASNDEEQNQKLINDLCQTLDKKIANKTSGIIGYQICNDLASIEKIYAMRKKAVGLLGNTKGWAKPIPFVEDTCVPPKNLADYITEFRQLLDSYQLEYGMFGHVDAGVLHVRPALDLCDKQQVETFKTISDEVVKLTSKYGGLIWGEHGKGMRSYYGQHFFGEELWYELRYIKQLFDPQNRLNPGKICTPLESKDKLYPIDSPMRADFDRQIPLEVKNEFKGAISCNGNGLCFNFDVHSVMCPSMKITGNRVFSPKGRATLIREWLRLLAEQGVKPDDLIFKHTKQTLKLTDFIAKLRHQWNKNTRYDFSHEVKMAMDTCLACKACASQCPIKIDVPTFRSQFNHLYHQRYFRPVKDYVVSNLEFVVPLMAKTPRFYNFFSTTKIAEKIANKTIGMTDLPALSTPNLQQQLVKINYQGEKLETIEHWVASGHLPNDFCKFIFVIQDPFTSYYDAKVVTDFVHFCQKIGFKPIVLPFKPTGKAAHIKGFLNQFSKTAKNQAEFLNRVAKLNIPMVGVDPALVLLYRDEYNHLLQEQRGDFNVLLVHEWLNDQIKNKRLDFCKNLQISDRLQWYLFSHCTETTALPNSTKEWQQIFEYFNQTLNSENVGCCGMAGTFGHETQHIAMSKAIYEQSWQTKFKDKPIEQCLATGYSCRSQVKRMEKVVLKHPIQALLSVLVSHT
ncbi:FAD-binding and (Fe-S)-binding domain-containing protein [Pasteurella skyensis]|uniref:D-2-hydroxyglutarate dehydrogenase n=1 Tax=Phocoenobacter skyensis TaxID=97481 RepID=A0AAJ6P3C6_9PAST|nr:FAD-binding and (Fe-S)-binding domain-containing protein [Pasteurella skyensis]MDP8171492.1 FAD-binding and (Fe-S)-binding domain-containing protein [Pasteurella skyensis]MDP8175727.1 FAD-binding and (Fe-S)-binding domain-containing protein [Pasteurella skyensis]